MKKTSFLVILLAALVLAAGVVTKDSELVKSYVPVLLEQLQAMDTAVPKEMPPKAEAKTQDAVKTADDILAVTALDIGQGDSILVQMQGKNILIDSGDRSEAARLLTKLEENHVEQIDMLIATHPHADHIGGMKAVLNRFPVKQVYDSGQEVPVNEMVKLKVLSPQALYKGTPSDTNNNSLVLRLEYKDFAMLLTGDIQAEVERDLLQTDPAALQAQVLKVAHHGSKTSSINEFLAAVKPKIAVISSGEGNKYKHPSPEVVQRLYNLQADVFNTALCGDIIIKSNGKTCDITVEKFYDEQQAQAA